MIEKVLLVTPPPHDAKNIINSKRSKMDTVNQQGRQALPSGLMSIGAYLQSKNYEVEVKDFWESSWDEIKAEIIRSNPDAVFSSCLTDSRQSNFKLSRVVREVSPEIINVIGNAHASIMYEQILANYPEIDYVIRGEGEITAHELLECINRGGDLREVKGIAFKSEGKIYLTEKRPFIEDLDVLPYPTENRFYLDGSKIACINVSRGCPYGCTYCSLTQYWQRWRGRSVEKVLEEVEFLVSEGAKYLVFTDDHFTYNKKRAVEIVQGFENYDFKWRIQSRVDRVDLDMLKLFEKRNIDTVAFGVETMSPTIINNIHKGVTLEQIFKAFELAHQAGIPEADANIMIGLPGETQQTVNETIQGLNIIKPDAMNKFITMIYPGTGLYELAKAKGMMTDDFWLTQNMVPFFTAENDLATLRKWSLQVQLAWYRQRGLVYSVKDIAGIFMDHGVPFALDYLKDGLSRVRLTKIFGT